MVLPKVFLEKNKISILHSSIKTGFRGHVVFVPYQFQFYIVQLRHSDEALLSVVDSAFQFYIVQLRLRVLNRPAFNNRFQFYIVQLRP